MNYTKIIGTGICLPEVYITNDDLINKFKLDTTNEWIVENTNIRQRYICKDGETSTSLGCTAVKQAIENANLKNEDIDMLIVATTSPDKVSPSTACLIKDELKDVKGVIVPGGFGVRGIEGKIKVIQYARENNIPFLGLCYGLQLAVIEYARNVCKLISANSTEIDKETEVPIIDVIEGHESILGKGKTMRLGSYKAILKENSRVYNLYNSREVYERHRHHYEVNPKYHNILEEKGMILSGLSEDGILVEFVEIPEHKFFVATQSHPELKSCLDRPAPLFYGFMKACLE